MTSEPKTLERQSRVPKVWIFWLFYF